MSSIPLVMLCVYVSLPSKVVADDIPTQYLMNCGDNMCDKRFGYCDKEVNLCDTNCLDLCSHDLGACVKNCPFVVGFKLGQDVCNGLLFMHVELQKLNFATLICNIIGSEYCTRSCYSTVCEFTTGFNDGWDENGCSENAVTKTVSETFTDTTVSAVVHQTVNRNGDYFVPFVFCAVIIVILVILIIACAVAFKYSTEFRRDLCKMLNVRIENNANQVSAIGNSAQSVRNDVYSPVEQQTTRHSENDIYASSKSQNGIHYDNNGSISTANGIVVANSNNEFKAGNGRTTHADIHNHNHNHVNGAYHCDYQHTREDPSYAWTGNKVPYRKKSVSFKDDTNSALQTEQTNLLDETDETSPKEYMSGTNTTHAGTSENDRSSTARDYLLVGDTITEIPVEN